MEMNKEIEAWFLEEVTKVKGDLADLSKQRERLESYLIHLEGVVEHACAHRPGNEASAPSPSPSFTISLVRSNYKLGQFNMPVALDALVTNEREIKLATPDGHMIRAWVDRKQNKNGTARIRSAALRRWFETFPEGSEVRSTIESPDFMRLEPVVA